MFPQGNPTRFSGFVFNVFDKDLDGTITFSEFLMALSVTSRGNVDEKLNCEYPQSQQNLMSMPVSKYNTTCISVIDIERVLD